MRRSSGGRNNGVRVIPLTAISKILEILHKNMDSLFSSLERRLFPWWV